MTPDQLELRITLPATATDDEIAEAAAKMILAANAAHQASGGSGLKPDEVKVYRPKTLAGDTEQG